MLAFSDALLLASGNGGRGGFHVPLWVVIIVIAIAVGTALVRIVRRRNN